VSRPTTTLLRGPALVTTGVLLILVTAASQGLTPSPQRSLPPGPATPTVVADPGAAEELARRGIDLATGWQPTGVVEADDPWTLLDGANGVVGWVDRLPRVRISYDDAGRLFVEDAAVVADPAHCYHLARIVRSVGVGLPPPVGPHIASQLEAWLEPPYFSGIRTPVGRGPCSGSDRTQWGFSIEQAEPLPCVVPGREVVCFTLAKWRYDFGPRDLWTSTHRAFDVRTGERLSDDELHPGLDVVAFDALVDDAICTLTGSCGGLAPREGRIHPTRTALVIELSPGEAADPSHGSLRLTVPRRSLPLAVTAP
jgi:hypothetical protein